MQPLRASHAISAVSLDDVHGLVQIEDFIAKHRDARLFHRPAWLRAVADGCRMDGYYVIAQDRGGELTGLVPVTRMRSRLFGRALVSSAFGVGGGILGEPEAAIALADRLWQDAVAGDYASVELRGGTAPGPEWRAEDAAHANFARDLAADDEAELLAIPRKQRAEVRRAIGFDLDVRIGRDDEERATHYAIYAESVRNLGTPVFPRRLFDAMLEHFADAGFTTIRKDGVALSSVLSFRHAGAIMPYWGGGTVAARTWRANEALYWALMSHARDTGCTRFDFGRSKLGSGAYAFKKNWGFVPQPLRYWTRGPLREVSPNDPRYRRRIELWKKLPLPVANLLGPSISRGLG